MLSEYIEYTEEFQLGFLELITKENIYGVGGASHTFHILDFLIVPFLMSDYKAVVQTANSAIERIINNIKPDDT